jgi:chromosome segregation ATPase
MTGYTARGHRYYRCTSAVVELDPARRCRRSLRADDTETRVWSTMMQILEHPELVAAEVAKRQASMHEQEAAIDQELRIVERELAECDREVQRRAEAYAGEVINLAELRAYRAEIDERRQSWTYQREDLAQRREAALQAVDQVGALIDYCERVRNRLRTFSVDEQHVAFDALALKVYWTPGEEKDLRIEASIALESIASQPSRWCC